MRFLGLLLLLLLATSPTIGSGASPAKAIDDGDVCSDPTVTCARIWKPAG
jgi:hypothetical protein